MSLGTGRAQSQATHMQLQHILAGAEDNDLSRQMEELRRRRIAEAQQSDVQRLQRRTQSAVAAMTLEQQHQLAQLLKQATACGITPQQLLSGHR
jgi:hypothetical protein